jgi:hypothetical protein
MHYNAEQPGTGIAMRRRPLLQAAFGAMETAK